MNWTIGWAVYQYIYYRIHLSPISTIGILHRVPTRLYFLWFRLKAKERSSEQSNESRLKVKWQLNLRSFNCVSAFQIAHNGLAPTIVWHISPEIVDRIPCVPGQAKCGSCWEVISFRKLPQKSCKLRKTFFFIKSIFSRKCITTFVDFFGIQ